ncbi:hypothetical protein RRG08_007785 [Elysia crispata]|uniref:Uncharacterized protein n=1 Tax=Elysia crispata TaxID=231223 RepID=A0AAE1B2R8_9GAST|nr:hypothetical protein RRG08_007785 [Elysia crispata]
MSMLPDFAEQRRSRHAARRARKKTDRHGSPDLSTSVHAWTYSPSSLFHNHHVFFQQKYITSPNTRRSPV